MPTHKQQQLEELAEKCMRLAADKSATKHERKAARIKYLVLRLRIDQLVYEEAIRDEARRTKAGAR